MLHPGYRWYLCVLLTVFLVSYHSSSASAMDASYDVGFRCPLNPPKTEYDITLKYDESSDIYIGYETLEFVNDTELQISEIAIEWIWGSMAEMKVENIDSLGRQVDAGGNLNIIELKDPVAPGKKFKARISFQYPSFPFFDDMNILTDWYPRIWWGRSTLDDYTVSIAPPADCVVLASGLPDESGATFAAQDIRSFGIVLAKGYDVLEADSGPVRISVLANENNRECAELLLETAADCIAFYTEWLGFYPHESLAIIPGMEEPMGGYPVASAIVAVHGQGRMSELPLSRWRFITAHEVGHQYWMEYVLEAPRNQWLMTGLGVYTDREYMLERGYGDTHEREMIERYMKGMEEGAHTRMDLSSDERMEVDFDYNNIVTHGKGFGLISSLACYLGKDIFDAIYLEVLGSYKGCEVNSSEFQAVCENASGEDLAWFFDQWIYTNRYLCFETDVESRIDEEGRYVTEVVVTRTSNMEMPVPVDATFEDGSRQRMFTDRLMKKTYLEFVSDTPPTDVKLDAYGEMPILDNPLPPDKAELSKRIRGLQYKAGQTDEALYLLKYADTEALDNTHMWMKLGMVLLEGGYLDEAYQAFTSGLELEGDDGSYAYVLYAWQGHIHDMKGERAEALECYRKALDVIKPGSCMRHDQFGIEINEGWLKERLETPFSYG